MTRGEVGIKVHGIDELRKSLRAVDKGLGKEFGKVNWSLGQKIVEWSKPRRAQMATRFGSYRSDFLTVKPSRAQAKAQILVRPGAAEFGTLRHPVFGTWMAQSDFVRRVWPSPNRSGWLVRPTINENRPRIESEYIEAVADLARRVGFEVT